MNSAELYIRENNTQKVYLTENTIDVFELLKTEYSYIWDSIQSEEIILKADQCSLFKELVFENKVVGFCSYDFSRDFMTAALNNIYVLPQFRGNGLFFDELQRTMLEHNKPSIVEPTHFVVELLIRYGFAKKISDSIVASAIEFVIPGDNVISNADYDNSELSTHFYDLNISASIHFLDLENNSVAYSSPLNYDIIHYDCIIKRNSINDDYFSKIREFFKQNDAEIMKTVLDLEESLGVKSYTLEEIVGGDGSFSPYIESLLDDAHISYDKAYEIKQQITEEYEAGMILNESLLIRLAYLTEENPEPSVTSHSDTCPYCSMPVDSHDRFCHFCGINLDYDANEMFNSLADCLETGDIDVSEDISYVAYKFLMLIREGINLNYALMTIENAYDIDWDILEDYISQNGYFKCDNITQKGIKFLNSHPMHYFEEYELFEYNYTDFEEFFYKNRNLEGYEIVEKFLKKKK